MMRILLPLVALGSGMALAVQVGMNNMLRSRMGNPLLAALVSFAIGLVALFGFVALSRPVLPDRGRLLDSPWWAWGGGLVGAVYVASAAAFAARLGAASWLGLIVTGQILASLTMDHYGLVGFPQRPVTLWKLAGALIMLAGVTMVVTAESQSK